MKTENHKDHPKSAHTILVRCSITGTTMEPHQCVGTTAKGVRCKIVLYEPDEIFCGLHREQW